MAWDWDQKRKQIAATLNNSKSGGAGWGGALASIGAGIEANPAFRWGPQSDVEMAGGQAATGGNQGLLGNLLGSEGLLGREGALFGDEGLLGGLWGGPDDGSLGNLPQTPSVNSMDEAAKRRLLQARGGLY
jgi:hypothetical protein